MELFKKVVASAGPTLYVIFRVLVGLLFMQHGAQKLFGLLGGNAQPLFSLLGLAGVIEFFGGLLIVLGLLSRLVALIAGVEMLVAYFKAHAAQSFFPLVNRGEPTLLFFAAFVIIFIYGGKHFCLDKLFFKKDVF